MKRQEYLSAHVGEEIDEEELENQMRQITGSMEDDIPHVTLNVENFYTPEEARGFVNDVLRECYASFTLVLMRGQLMNVAQHVNVFFLF